MTPQDPRPESDFHPLVDLAPTPAPAAPAQATTPAPPPADTGATPAAAPEAAPAGDAVEPAQAAPPKPKSKVKKPGRRRRWDTPSWLVSMVVHAVALFAVGLGFAQTGAVEELAAQLDTSLVSADRAKEMAEELVHVYTEPADAERDLASDDQLSLGGGGGPPTATPTIRTSTAEVSERGSLGGIVEIAVPTPSTAMLPPAGALNHDLGGRISGDVIRESQGYDEALDQLANEILRQLEKSRVTVLWLFDESGSMKDDQATVRDKFDRVINELNLHVPSDRKAAGDLEHAIVGFGNSIHYENQKPTAELDRIKKSISSLPVDETGVESTMTALGEVVGKYGRAVDKDRKILLVLVTDESSDDGSLVEAARTALVNRGVVLYVMGRQAMFGYDRVHLRYIDPVTKDVYWPAIKRGPESAGAELLQYDGLWQDRIEEQSSGFAPYELARLVQETGGIYFLLPNEEELRNRPHGEKAYPISVLKEYIPDYDSRPEYASRLTESPMRSSLVEIVRIAKQDQFGFRRHFSVQPAELADQMMKEIPRTELQFAALGAFEKRLRALKGARDAEPDRRWQANYDLMLAQVVANQVKALEYRACLEEMIALARQGKLVPKNPPIPNKRRTDWVIDHSSAPRAPKGMTEKKQAEAISLLNKVKELHADTPWADLAQTLLNRGLSCSWGEWSVHPDYDKRAELVPKF